MLFPEDVPNSSQSFMSVVDQVYYFFKTCTYSLFIYTLSIKLFVPLTISIFPIFCNLNWILNKAATPDSSLLVYALIFPALLFLGEKQNWSFDPCIDKALIIGTLTGNDTNIQFLKSCSSIKQHLILHNQIFIQQCKHDSCHSRLS